MTGFGKYCRSRGRRRVSSPQRQPDSTSPDNISYRIVHIPLRVVLDERRSPRSKSAFDGSIGSPVATFRSAAIGARFAPLPIHSPESSHAHRGPDSHYLVQTRPQRLRRKGAIAGGGGHGPVV